MPFEVSQKTIPILKEWISYFVSIPMIAKMKELINKYLDEGKNEGAFKMLEILLSVDEPEIKIEYHSLYNTFHFIFSDQEDIRENFKNLDLTTQNNKYLQVLCNCLSKYLEKEMHTEDGKDLSEIWRSNVVTKSREDIENLLVDEIIDYLTFTAEIDLVSLKSKHDLLSNYKWVIFKRIRLYLLNSYPEIFTEEIESSLSDPEIFQYDKYWTEYSELLKNNFSLISKSAQEKIISWIRNGPDYSKYGITPDLFTSENKYQDYKEIFRKNWLIKKSKPIYESLPPDLIEFYDSIKLESREIEVPSKKKKLEPEELRSLTIEELILYLNDHPNDSNLRYLLMNFINENPSKYIKLLLKFSEIPFFYLSHIVEGFTRTLGGDKKFKINECVQGVIQISKEFITDEDLAMDIGFWRYIISFFNELLSLKNIQIEGELLKEIWGVICALLTIKEPRIKTQDTTFENYVQFSINTYTGAVLWLIIKYALYYASISDLPAQNRMIPDVKEKLEELLDPENDSAKIIWSIIAYNLYNLFYLDDKWAASKIPIIFSEENQDLWLIAWESKSNS